jgi:hypothetical protein
MKVNLKLARVGMNMAEATIAKWHKQPGESFKTGDVLYEIEEIAEVGAAVCSVDAKLGAT